MPGSPRLFSQPQWRELGQIHAEMTALQARLSALIAAVSAAEPVTVPVPPSHQHEGTAGTPPAATSDTTTAQPAAGAVPQGKANRMAGPLRALSLKDAIVEAIARAAGPLSFDEVFAQLEKAAVTLPPRKPKLAVRKMLYGTPSLTVVKGGKFTLTADVEGDGAEATPKA